MKYLFLILLVGCGTLDPDVQNTRIKQSFDKELKPYLDSYMTDLRGRTNLRRRDKYLADMHFVETIDDEREDGFTTLAQCEYGYDMSNLINSNTIVVARKYWEHYTELERKALMYHELTHCLFLLDHSDDPNSLMYWAPPTDENEWIGGWQGRLDDLIAYINKWRP